MALRINQRDDGPITILDLSGKVAAAAGDLPRQRENHHGWGG